MICTARGTRASILAFGARRRVKRKRMLSAAGLVRMERMIPRDHCDLVVFRGKIVDDALFISMLLWRGGDASTIAWDREAMPHTICSILDNGDRRAAAFAMPATCEPKGYTAEKRKGNLSIFPSGAVARFVTLIGYVDKASAGSAARGIEGSAE